MIETRDKFTNDFIDNLDDHYRYEWGVFLEGFNAAFEMSGLTHMPGDLMVVFDSYVDFIGMRSKEGWYDGRSDEPVDSRSEQRKWLGHAMIVVREFPEWSNAKIAREVGKHPSTLSRSKEFQIAAGVARGEEGDKNEGSG